MDKEKELKQEEVETEKAGFLQWIKEYKKQLALAGVSVVALITMVLGLKNKDSIAKLWESLKELVEKGEPMSAKWFEKADLKELEEVREKAQKDFLNPNLGLEERSYIWDHVLPVLDNAISKKKWAGEEHGFPVRSEHGWHLPSD